MLSLINLIFIYVRKYIVCDACGLRSRTFYSNNVLYITPTYTSPPQELIFQGIKQNEKGPAFDVEKKH